MFGFAHYKPLPLFGDVAILRVNSYVWRMAGMTRHAGGWDDFSV